MILHCESCEHGYHKDLPVCRWCGAGSFLAYAEKPEVRVLDTECYKNFWLCKVHPPLPGTTGEYQLFPDHPLEREELERVLSLSTIVTFNGQKYDVPMITLALAGATNEQLKAASDQIIRENLQPWEFYDRWQLGRGPEWLDHIDLIEVAPGRTSLKEYGGKMHSRKMQDLPIEVTAMIELFDRPILREYCGNDLDTTFDLFRLFGAQIKLREEMSEEYGLDLRSKSDAQIAEAIMKKLLGGKIQRVEVPSGTRFFYRPPPWLKFQNLDLLNLLARSPFTVTPSGGVEMTAELANTRIRIGGSAYQMGIGGLHSTESARTHMADGQYSLRDVDVASYYPTLMLVTGIIPPAIGPRFVEIYRGWFERRLAAKKAGNKKTANSLKTLLNGTFGKLGSIWSIFYAPSEMIQVTVTGQLALLMLIEMLELCGISVVSANTDGIVIKCPRDLEWLRDQTIDWWQSVTGFETEAADYLALCSRDVNNYVAVKTDGEVKLKGAYARPVPVATSWPNPTGEVCIDAIVERITKGTPIEVTVRACQDVRKFVHIRKVKGGGEWRGVFLGKAVRWYYSTAPDAAEITYIANGNKVAQSEGCRPMMELPENNVVPVDIDYERYIADARAMLADLGIMA
jgi:hypothetical protein